MNDRSLVFLLTMGIIGFAAQFVDGTLGMGYGVFSTSLLITGGLAPAVASASVHTAEIVTTLVSGVSHHRLGNVDMRLAATLAAPGMIGGVVGAVFLANLPGDMVRPWVAGFLLMMGLTIIWRFARTNSRDGQNRITDVTAHHLPCPTSGYSALRVGGIGFIAAAFDAFGGGGWGPIATPTLLLGHHVKPHTVVGSVNLAEFFVTSAIAVAFFFSIGPEAFDWTIIICLLIGGVIAAPAAAWLCKKLPHALLGMLIGILLLITNLRTLIMVLA